MSQAAGNRKRGRVLGAGPLVIGAIACLMALRLGEATALERTSVGGVFVDQQQPAGDPKGAFPPGTTFADFFTLAEFPFMAQSFRPAADNIVGASTFIPNSGPNPEVQFEIRIVDTLAATAQPLKVGKAQGKVGTWVDAMWLDEPLTLKRDATYFLVFAETAGFNRFRFAGAYGSPSADPYPRGVAFLGKGDFELRGDPAVDRFDYAFKTFAIPEPATGLLLLVGLLALAARPLGRPRTA